MLADTGGEDDGVQPLERRDKAADMRERTIDEQVHRLGCPRVAAREQLAHVVADPGYPQQSASMIQEVAQRLGVHAHLLQQVQHHPGVERARPRAHHQALHGRESHAGRDALPAAHCAQACAVAQVCDDDTPLSALAEVVRKHARDVFVGQTVKAVAPDAEFLELPRQGEQGREPRLARVKTGVEAGNLGKRRCNVQQGADRRQIVRLVERREGNECLQRGHDLAIHKYRLAVSRPAVNDTVPGGDDAGPSCAL